MNKTDATTNTPSYRRYVLLMLTGVYVFNFIDRQILVILQESVKKELLLSDTQLGILTGFAFAVFYVILGLPIARWADRYSRRNIITLSLALWSAMTAISGMAQNYLQLLLARIGVGVGEAGGSPPAHSMISDYFPEEKRATALSVYSVGIYIGVLIGYLSGGWIDEFWGWRLAFWAVGIPGVVYALIFYFTVREPVRGLSEGLKSREEELPGYGEVLWELMRRRTFWLIALASGFNTFVTYGLGNWFPSFMIRIHEMGTGEVGTWLAIAAGIGGGGGTWLGGYLSDYLGRKDARWYLWLTALCIAISAPIILVALFSPNKYLALLFLTIAYVLWTTYLGPSIAMIHGMVSSRMRATASAVFFLILNFIGLGLGPLSFGMVSDWLAPSMGVESLRWSLSGAFFLSLISASLFAWGSKYLKADLK